jgi:glutathione synthase/RimK-type ligase-like ATP-grasp enzyme
VSLVYLASCSRLPNGDGDDGPSLLRACDKVGLDASWQVWHDRSVDWERADLVVVRATWDYAARLQEFLAWAEGRTNLANAAPVLRWNSDKRYLQELGDAGVPIVPTTWVERGEEPDFPESGDFVVKPTVGAGSVGAARFSTEDPASGVAARAHVADLHRAGRTAMIQPYLAEVDTAGETALIFIGGKFSHAIRKAPMLPSGTVNAVDGQALFVAEMISRRDPTEAERALADRVLGLVPGDLLYARVDLLPTPAGPVVIELELTEPSLFLVHDPGSADRLAAAIARRCAG